MNMISIRNSIYHIIEKVIIQGFHDCTPELIDILNKYQTLFINILENDPLSPTDRNLIVNSVKDPIQISGLPQKLNLTTDFIQETIIISDLFNLNEMTSVELLLSGEAEVTSNPDMSRGLIAVLNYYSSQKTIVDSLKNLLQAKLIIKSDNPLSTEILNFTEIYCDNLFQNGLFSRLIHLLKKINIKTEIELLESQRALGTAKHRRQFYIIYNSIKETLAECIMLRAFKTPLSSKEMTLLVEFMREIYQENNKEIKVEENQSLSFPVVRNPDKCFVYLLTSLLNSMNPLLNANSLNNASQDCFNHPFFTDDGYVRVISELILININDTTIQTGNVDHSVNYHTKSVVKNFNQLLYLAWIISLQKMSHIKQDSTINQSYHMTSNFGDYEDFERHAASNFDSGNVYECLTFLSSLLCLEGVYDEIIIIKCTHDLVTDLIIYQPKMIKDLRNESLGSRSNVVYFSSLLGLIGQIHGAPESLCDLPTTVEAYNGFRESMALEFWSPQEILSVGSDLPMMMAFDEHTKHWSVKSNESYRQAILFKFIRDCGNLFDQPELFVNYIFMLKGLCVSNRIAVYIYSMLNSNQIGRQSFKLTWNWFSNSIYQHSKFLISNPHKTQMMDPMELDGLLVVLQLIKRVTKMSVKVCEAMVCNESLMLVQNLILLLSCGVPKLLKAELLNCLSVFCQSTLVAKSIWQSLESNKIISSSPETANCGIHAELCETEPKLEEFFITRAFLNFLLAITPHIACDISILDQSTMTYDRTNSAIISVPSHYTMVENLRFVIQFVMETVFLKYPMRTYRNIEEKFAICESFLRLCCKCVKLFLSQSGNLKNTKSKISWCQYDAGFFIVTQLLTESPFFKTVINIIDSGFVQLSDTLNNITFGPKTYSKETVDLLGSSIYLAMELVSVVLKNESFLVDIILKFNSQFKNEHYRSGLRFSRSRNVVPQELSKLLMTTGCAQLFLPNIIKYIGIVDEKEQIALKALSIFNSCVTLVQPHSNLMLMLTNRNVIDNDILPLMVNCLDKFGETDLLLEQPDLVLGTNGVSNVFFNHYEHDSARTLVLKILINCLQQPTPNFGQYLMGFSCSNVYTVRRTSLQEAGVGDFPKTCLHSLLNLIQRLMTDMVSSPFFKEGQVPTEYLAMLTANMIDLGLCYRILYLLASGTHTSNAVLRFIRSNYQFIFNQIDLLSFSTIKLVNMPELRALIWNQKSWLLKIIAVEVRLCTANQQRSYISKLLKLLFGDDLYSVTSSTFLSWLSVESVSSQGIVYQLLEDLEITEPEELNDFTVGQRLKPEILKEYLNDSQEDTYMGIRLVNVSKVKQMILADINLTADEEQIRVVQYEIDNICQFVNKYNTNIVWLTFGKMAAVEAWRQVVEVVMLSDCSAEDSINGEVMRKKIYDLLQIINEKILVSSTPSCLVDPFSRVCLILSTVLAGMFTTDHKSPFMLQVMPGDKVDNVEEKRLELLDVENLHIQLKTLIKLTIRCIMEINYKVQNTRIKFYGVLTYLLEIVLKISKIRPNFSNLINECYLTIHSQSVVTEKISEKSLYSTVCCDCISGNIILALSSLTVLDCLASIDKGSGDLIGYLASHGYLNHFIESLVKDCDTMFLNMKHVHDTDYTRDSGTTGDLYSYFLYQSRMSLLCNLAAQPSGAKVLVQTGAMTSLSRCELFRNRPLSFELMNPDEEDLEDIVVQYRNVMSFAVQFATNILASCGLDKTDTVREVLVFVACSIDSLCKPFQTSNQATATHSIKEMIQISNLFVLLVPGMLRSTSLEVEYQYRTLEKIKATTANSLTLLVSLLSKPIHHETDTMLQLLQLQLLGNLLSVACAFVAPSSNESQRFFFSTNVDDALGGKNNWSSLLSKISQSVISGNKPPMSLAIIILYKMQEFHDSILKKIAYFVSPDYENGTKTGDSGRLLAAREVEEILSRMSRAQLQNLWNSVFDIVSTSQQLVGIASSGTMSGQGYFLESGQEHTSIDRNGSETDLVTNLLVVYVRLGIVLSSVARSLESCLFLIWSHAAAYRRQCGDSSSLGNDTSLHPLQRLQIQHQYQREIDQHQQRGTTSVTSNGDITVLLSKCIDEEVLLKIQAALNESPSDEYHMASFSRILIHRLLRMMKLS